MQLANSTLSNKVAYEYRKYTPDKTKCILKDNINEKEYIIKMPYPFGHSFWRRSSDDPQVIKVSLRLISKATEED